MTNYEKAIIVLEEWREFALLYGYDHEATKAKFKEHQDLMETCIKQ